MTTANFPNSDLPFDDASGLVIDPAVQASDAASWGRGVAPAARSLVLQRGGDEVLLERSGDRFAVVPKGLINFNWEMLAGFREYRSLGLGLPLDEVQVDPAQRDFAMETARLSRQFEYVSHVYHLANEPQTLFYTTNELTVQFAPEVTVEAAAMLLAGLGLRQIEPIDGLPNGFVFALTERSPANPIALANDLMVNPSILIAEPNVIVPTQRFYTPRDSYYAQQWYLNHRGGTDLAANSHISVERAWDITRGSRSVVVAITDDGIDVNHPDLRGAGKIVAPRDFRDNDFTPLPGTADDSHGTACAGVAVGEETGTGIVGVAPGCAMMPIRTTGYLDDRSIEEMFNWCIDRGAAIISCSWGPSSVYFPLSARQQAVISKAATRGRKGKGCIVVFASGNANRPVSGAVNEQGWPKNAVAGTTQWLSGYAVHPDVIAVSASTSLNRKAAYSNWGPNISVCAPSNNAPPGVWLAETGSILTPPEVRTYLPGKGIFTADRLGSAGYSRTDFTGTFGGTSSACPAVAGVAALVLSANPNLTAAQVRAILEDTADKIVDNNPDPQLGFRYGTYNSRGHSFWFGYGKVNAYEAVRRAAGLGGNTGGTGGGTPQDDVTGHWAESFIEALIERDIMKGFAEDGTFRPQNDLTRAQFAALLVKAFDLPLRRSPSRFWDVSSSFWGAAAIDKCYRMGFLSGFPDGSFRPNDPLTRAQSTVALVNGLSMTGGPLDLLGLYSDRDDIPNYAKDEIATATLRRIVVAYPSTGQMRPNQPMTRGEMAAALYQALVATGQAPPVESDYIVEPGTWLGSSASPMFTDLAGHWAQEFVEVMVLENVMSGYLNRTFKPDEPVNRAQLAALLAHAFEPQVRRSPQEFSDVPPDFWAATAINQVYQGRFMSGIAEDRFGPNDPVTRLQLTLALASGLGWLDGSRQFLDALQDVDTVPSWAAGAVAAAIDRQILVNYPDPDRFEGDRPITRAEVAAFVHQAMVAEGDLGTMESPDILAA
ncbi:MAG: S-layer homology domain-containing protein [Cyanobacteria bacterium P01_D01_bin.73]